MTVEIIILAAGQGKRMHSALPKALHTVGGKPMLQHLLETTSILEPGCVHVIVGHGKDQVIDTIEQQYSSTNKNLDINWVEQTEQRGTGHAVMQAMPDVDPDATVLILNGDVPLISLDTLEQISNPGNNLNLLTAVMVDPTGSGRIIRDDDDHIVDIVEERDASDQQKTIPEVNTNCMSAKASGFSRWLPQINCDNAQNEYYLTDVIACAVNDNTQVVGIQSKQVSETEGVNSKTDLARLERIYQSRIAETLMAAGVTLRDPNRLDVRGICQFGNDCTVDINVILEGNVQVGDGVQIGPNTLIRNTTIGDGSIIESNCVIDNAVIGKNCNIGPFARIRPETTLNDEVKIGNFVEIKKSNIEEKSKVNHLSYVGDTQVGRNTNIGAGTITCNYDGANKHRTTIGNNVFVGSGTQFVAPIEVADGATVGAGSTITDNIKENALAVSRAKQRSIPNWKRPNK